MKKVVTLLAAALLALTMNAPVLAAPPMETRLIVDAYALAGDALTPGGHAELSFTLRNTHDKQLARNIAVTASCADGALLCRGRNMLYLAQLDAGKTAPMALDVKASDDAAAGVHTVTLDIRYEDGRGMPLTLSVAVPVEVKASKQPSEELRLFADTPAALPADAADPVTVKFGVHNLGKVMIYNIFATAEGRNLTAVGGDAYAGNLESGKSADVELTMAFDRSIAEAVKKSDAWKTAQPGDAPLTLEVPAEVVIRYEDADGNPHTQRVQFVTRANIPKPQEPAFAVAQAPAANAPARQDPTGWAVAAVALAVAAVAVALGLWSRRRRAGR